MFLWAIVGVESKFKKEKIDLVDYYAIIHHSTQRNGNFIVQMG